MWMAGFRSSVSEIFGFLDGQLAIQDDEADLGFADVHPDGRMDLEPLAIQKQLAHHPDGHPDGDLDGELDVAIRMAACTARSHDGLLCDATSLGARGTTAIELHFTGPVSNRRVSTDTVRNTEDR